MELPAVEDRCEGKEEDGEIANNQTFFQMGGLEPPPPYHCITSGFGGPCWDSTVTLLLLLRKEFLYFDCISTTFIKPF